ncbi:MAG: 4-hydroxy-3-methylbut-2-enyl diphosphate reductase [Candidatus Omnitrophota bacterium]
MKVNLAESAGFCFGVKRALDIALRTIKVNKNVFMLGDIVHNEEVVNQIRKAGINKIKKPGLGIGKTLLIRAHGTGRGILNKAKRSGYKIVDATCPMVKEIHNIAARMELRGYQIIVIGDKKHDEVLGIIGQLCNKAIVIDDINLIEQDKIGKIDKACVVVQSTQNLETVTDIIGSLKKQIKELKFFNTICGPTRMKQQEIKKIPLNNDAVVIIGSKKSANTRRLYEISKSINSKSYWINSKKEIKPAWFRLVNSIGVTAGASTPETTIQDIVNYLSELN